MGIRFCVDDPTVQFTRRFSARIPPGFVCGICTIAIAAFVFATLLIESRQISAQETCTISWTSTEDGSWLTASNWDQNRVPDEGDHVCIPDLSGDGSIVVAHNNPLVTTVVASVQSLETLRVSSGTLNLTDASVLSSSRKLVLSGGELGGAGSIEISDLFEWGQGRLSGTGTTHVLPDARMDIVSLPRTMQDGRTLINDGTASWSEASITLGQDTLFHNRGTLTIDLGLANMAAPGDGQLLLNDGTIIHKSGSVSIFASTTNNGRIDVEGGTFRLNGSGAQYSSTGDMTVAEGATLLLGGSVASHHVHTGDSSITGPGDVIVTGANFTLDGEYSVGSTDVNGQATWSRSVTTGHLQLRGGNGEFEQSVSANSMAITGGSHTLLAGFSNHPATVSQGPGSIWIEGDLNISESFSWASGNKWGPGTTRILPGATLAMTPSAGTKTLNNGRNFENQGDGTWTGGLISIASGLGFHNTGTFDIAASGNVTMLGSNATFPNSGTTIKSGEGEAAIGPLFTNSGTLEVQQGRFRLNNSPTNYEDNTLTGGAYIVRDAASFRFQNADIQTNAATILLDGPDAVIVNQSELNGLRNFATNASDGSLTIQNGHLLTAPGPVLNSGYLEIGPDSVLTATGAYTQVDGETRLRGGTLAADLVDITTGLLSGEGTVDGDVDNSGTLSPGFSPGTLIIDGDYTQTATGSFKVEIEGVTQGLLHDYLQVEQHASLSGTLDIELVSFTPQTADQFTVMSYTTHTGEFDDVTLNDAELTPILTYGKTELILHFGIDVPEPASWPEDAELTATDVTPTTLTLHWTPATHPDNINAYRIYQDGAEIATVEGNVNLLPVSGLEPETTYLFRVEASGPDGVWTEDGPTLQITTLEEPSDEDPGDEPGINAATVWGPGNILMVNGVQETSLTLRWRRTRGDFVPVVYRVYQDGEVIVELAPTQQGTMSYAVTDLTPGQTYEFSVAVYVEGHGWTVDNPTVDVTTKPERQRGPANRGRP
jgi:hypothetical protein